MISVMDTNFEACKAKNNIVKLGYIKDRFIHYFYHGNEKKEVLINRGYWSRVFIFHRLVDKFLEKNKDQQKVQVISLGSGFDTLPFNIIKEKKYNNLVYNEIDLDEIVRYKINTINTNPDIKSLFNNITEDKEDILLSDNYNLAVCDITNHAKLHETLFEKFKLNKECPTLIISECVLIYLHEKEIKDLLIKLYSDFDNIITVDYDMVNFENPYGKMMEKNFHNMGIPLLGLNYFKTVETITNNYKSHVNPTNFEISYMKDLYYNFIDKEEIARIEKIEWLDEIEEFLLIQNHYFISISSKLTNNNIYSINLKDLN